MEKNPYRFDLTNLRLILIDLLSNVAKPFDQKQELHRIFNNLFPQQKPLQNKKTKIEVFIDRLFCT